MVAPVLAAGAARVAAVSGRAAASAGTAARSTAGATRSASQMKSQFQQARIQAGRFESVEDKALRRMSTRQQEETEEAEETDEMPMPSGSPTNQLKASMAMARTRFLTTQAASQQEAAPTQQLAQQAAKKMIPKAALWIVNIISGALELGTGGIALLVTFFIRLLTLAWYNIEMIFGGFIMKGKHPIIGPLTWDPIPMPFEKKDANGNSLGLTMLVIIADIVIIIALMLPIVLLGSLITLLTSPV